MTKPIEVDGNQITLQIQVQPRSSSNKWGRLVDNQWIQLRITSPPVDGAANKTCLKLIAKRFKTAKSMVSIIKGEKSRYKTITIKGYDAERLRAFLIEYPVV
ncbi:MAG: YggU family protein [Deltaproteobacteria bacterium]|jgi:uncharacterized protein|nr:YggU family protein [Deltaproteobacteria bacterium]MBT4267516.1 YggU family protein [Deltaproteobacteria bacterium]MBT4642360.1 YggU family protein [Deltaproteobacteria bacterium]MBT6498492.1 YggU family protein [Deltaproteobacteria bacterium]MBT6611863.1 YggU family protein [Deltaproteobacteria bacterium]